MPSLRQLYREHVGQTSELSMMLEIESAKGCYIYDTSGKAYIDMNSGISVSSIGHGNEAVRNAIQLQLDKHLHTMVYGEHVHERQVAFAQLLTDHLPPNLTSVYYLTTGSEAVETAMKLGRKYTDRYEVVACKQAYHGSTLGAESLRSDIDYKMHFAPVVPGVRHIRFNQIEDLNSITSETACVIVEPVQAEVGVRLPKDGYLQALRKRCDDVGCLLIFDEIQTGFGRTGSLFGFMKYGVVPDAICVGKAMGGGVPLSGVVSSREILAALIKNPALGHITTFGGHPLACAAAHASLQYLLQHNVVDSVNDKGQLIHDRLSKHPIVKEVRQAGMMVGVELIRRKYLKHVVAHAIQSGVLVDFFLFNDRSFRVAPPLVMDVDTLNLALDRLVIALDFAKKRYKTR